MDSHVIASGGLKSGRELYVVEIARFYFGLYQNAQDSVDKGRNKTEISDFRLNDNGLIPLPGVSVVRPHTQSLNGKKASGPMVQVAGIRVKAPLRQFRKRNRFDANGHFAVPPLNPFEEFRRGMPRSLPGEKGFEECSGKPLIHIHDLVLIPYPSAFWGSIGSWKREARFHCLDPGAGREYSWSSKGIRKGKGVK